ncbi:MAG TPA: SLC13 family permease [Spirillospora sp.]|nr:SLC13 family permease [Spirillospora sp.]
MTPEIAGFLLIFVAALVLFSREFFPPDVTALGLMLTLVVTGLLPVQAAFAGFGSDTVLMILGLLLLTEALERTGVVDMAGQFLVRFVGSGPERLQLLLLAGPGLLSSLMSNTASAAFFLPVALGLARRAKLSASKLLMPIAFASILASSVTLIATSTNLVVSGVMQQHNLAPLGMFELTPVGVPILIAGLLYMWFIGRRIIPDRTGVPNDPEYFDGSLYFSEITILPDSPEVDKTIEQSIIMQELNLGVLRLQRGGNFIKPLANTVIEPGDTLFVEGRREDILKIQTTPGLTVKGAMQTLASYLQEQKAQIAEVVLLPGSPLVGRTIKGLQLRERYRMQILAINQGGKISYSKIGRRVLRLGDILLIQMPEENLKLLESERLFRVLDIIETAQRNPARARLAIAIFVGALGLAVFNIFPIAVAVMIGALFAFLTRCITPEEAYRRIEWKTVILIGSMLAFGQAMQLTGTADYLAGWIARLPGADSPIGLLSFFFFLGVVLTQPMSNQAVAAILVPIAIQTALLLGYNPRPFAIMIAVAASASFITPLEPACVIVYSAGKYRFMDFVRVGALLTLVVYAIAIVLVPTFSAI